MFTDDSAAPRRIDFQADDPYQAFQAALNERGCCEVELWDGDRLLVRMSKTEINLWKLHGTPAKAHGPTVNPLPPGANASLPSGAAAA
ncbi:hypothetical protein [Sphingopyxis sp. KK2]|uniref:hypothetical protein n=1 Tax=Sphingopyxis sp. KK2 TaxID=1855727 RepID=UPI00097E7174|nr:hypothetical protein [Sphingopyxis sp. KK2]